MRGNLFAKAGMFAFGFSGGKAFDRLWSFHTERLAQESGEANSTKAQAEKGD
jgi:hypothetical protein